MQSKPDMLEIIARANTGEYISQKEWDTILALTEQA